MHVSNIVVQLLTLVTLALLVGIELRSRNSLDADTSTPYQKGSKSAVQLKQ
jgi:hypothetical protein